MFTLFRQRLNQRYFFVFFWNSMWWIVQLIKKMFKNDNRLNRILKKMKILWYCRIFETKLHKLFFSYWNNHTIWSLNLWNSTTSWYNVYIISHINCTNVTKHTSKIRIVKIRFDVEFENTILFISCQKIEWFHCQKIEWFHFKNCATLILFVKIDIALFQNFVQSFKEYTKLWLIDFFLIILQSRRFKTRIYPILGSDSLARNAGF